MLNENSSAVANADSSTNDEVTTSAKLLPNPMLGTVRFKYRAFNHVAKQMYYETKLGDVFKWQNEGQVQTIMESTNLKDKHGNEIWEGDILNVCNGSINGTFWMDKPYEVKKKLKGGFDMCMFCWDKEGNNIMDSTHWCEVIGNVYANPELLGK